MGHGPVLLRTGVIPPKQLVRLTIPQRSAAAPQRPQITVPTPTMVTVMKPLHPYDPISAVNHLYWYGITARVGFSSWLSVTLCLAPWPRQSISIIEFVFWLESPKKDFVDRAQLLPGHHHKPHGREPCPMVTPLPRKPQALDPEPAKINITPCPWPSQAVPPLEHRAPTVTSISVYLSPWAPSRVTSQFCGVGISGG